MGNPQSSPPPSAQAPIPGALTVPSNAPVTIGNNILSPPDYDSFTQICNPVYVREQHVTVIRRGPTMPPVLNMQSWDESYLEEIGLGDPDTNQSGKVVLSDDVYSTNMQSRVDNSGTGYVQNTPVGGGNAISCLFRRNKESKEVGDSIFITIDFTQPDSIDLAEHYKVIIKHSFTNSLGVTQLTSVRGVVTGFLPGGVIIELTSTPTNFPLALNSNQIYNITVIKKDPIFEQKFPRFAYRYRYEDGEYSVFSPWSEIAFIPGKFDYLPKKGYNLGMVNNLRTIEILNWRPKNIPKDVVEIDLLYKESNSPNVYTVETFEITDEVIDPWNTKGTGEHFGRYKVTSELIHKVVPSNQMLRPWDNVPRVALGQEITANRLIYANYLQNYNLFDSKDNYIKPNFSISINNVDNSVEERGLSNPLALSQLGATNQPKYPMKSLKSMRTYQLGVVYRDRYGRETPVLTSKTGSIKIPKSSAKLSSKFDVSITSESPDWAESYTFYVKETSNEYYNLSMDR